MAFGVKFCRSTPWKLIGWMLAVVWGGSGSAADPSVEEVEALRLELSKGRADSLHETVASAEEIFTQLAELSERAEEYGRLAVELSRAHRIFANYELAKKRALVAIEVGQKIANPKLEAFGHNALGGVYWRRGNYALVWKEWLDALTLREAIQDEAGMAATYSNMGILLDEQGDYPGALEYYTRALEIDRRIGSATLEIAATINNIGTVHEILENPELALKHYAESLKLRESVGDERGMATSLTNIGSALNSQGKTDEARQAFHQAMTIRRKSGERRNIASTLAEMGSNELNAGNLEEARRLAFESWEIRTETAEPWGVAHSALILGDTALAQGKPIEALEWFDRAQRSAAEIGAQMHLLHERWGVARAHAALGDWEQAFGAQREHTALQKEIWGEGARRRIELLEIQNETRRRESEISALKVQNERAEAELVRAEWERRVMIIGSLALFLFVTGLGWAFRMQSKAKAELENAHATLQQLGEEKDHFLGVVSHDLRSPLGNIRWMAGMIAQKPEEAAGVKSLAAMIDEVAGRLVATTTNLLDISRIEDGGLKPEGAVIELRELVDQVVSSFLPVAQKKHQEIEVKFATDRIAIFADIQFTQQILENLISNALKYAPSGSLVRVHAEVRTGTAVVQVIDQGPGIPIEKRAHLFKKFATIGSAPTGGEDSHGIGLAIARGLAESMDGSIVYGAEPDRGGGACFELTLPLRAG